MKQIAARSIEQLSQEAYSSPDRQAARGFFFASREVVQDCKSGPASPSREHCPGEALTCSMTTEARTTPTRHYALASGRVSLPLQREAATDRPAHYALSTHYRAPAIIGNRTALVTTWHAEHARRSLCIGEGRPHNLIPGNGHHTPGCSISPSPLIASLSSLEADLCRLTALSLFPNMFLLPAPVLDR
jgi:hypothetical protein